MKPAIDHLVVACADRDDGATRLAPSLGTAQGGGEHPRMGTHNRLWRLDDAYIETIAPDPSAAPPGRPRWFGLDAPPASPRLATWAMAVDDIERRVARCPVDPGQIVEMTRGGLKWRITIPRDGQPPFGGVLPALIEWDAESPHPAHMMPRTGWKIEALALSAPAEAVDALRGIGAERIDDVVIMRGPPAINATLRARDGRVQRLFSRSDIR